MYPLQFQVSLLVTLLLTTWSGAALAQQRDGLQAEAFGVGDFDRVQYNNPDVVADLGVGLWAWPLPMDYDEDGDMDLLVSTSDVPFNGLYFFENTSGEAFPVFAPPVRLGAGIRNVQPSYVDGEPAVLVPGAVLDDFRNAHGEKETPLYLSDAATKDVTKNRFNQWKLVDFEGDGDQDILIGVDDWGDYGWDNAFDSAGRWTNGPLHGYVYLIENQDGTYAEPGRLEAGGKPLDVYGAANAPTWPTSTATATST